MANLAEASKPVEVKKPQATPGWGVQFSEVFYRGAVSFWRNVPFMWTRMFVLTFLGLIYGFLYYQIGTENIAGISSKVAVVQTVAGFGGVISTATFMPVVMKDRAVFYRERTSGTYGAISYALTTFLIDLPYVFLAIVLFATPFYFLVGFENDATLFFKFLLAGYLNAVAFCTVGHLMTGVMPNLIVAGIAQGMFFSVAFLFGGLVIPGPEVPAGWRWLYSGNPLRHALEAMAMPQFNCDAYNDVSACPSVPVFTGTQFVQMTKAKYVKEYYGFGYNDYWNHIGYLILFIGIGRILAFRAIQKINHVKR